MDPKQLTYNIALWIFNILVDLFFREIRTRGAYRIPTEGPIIFVVGPHANQVGRTDGRLGNSDSE
jgi:glycerol-3-phosphate O-acyltransferase/dihydroxyacetone phosphate acyltransferase